MKQTDKQFVSKLQKHSKQIEQDKADVEWDETQGGVGGDVMTGFRRALRRGLQDAVDECLDDDLTQAERDERTEHELLRYELNKALAKSPEFRKQYLARERERRRRLEK